MWREAGARQLPNECVTRTRRRRAYRARVLTSSAEMETPPGLSPRRRHGRHAVSPPISRVLSAPCGAVTVIHLGRRLPAGSSNLPGDSAGRAIAPLFGLAPDGVFRAVRVATNAVRSYRTFSPLPENTPLARREPSAVRSLWHFPSPRGARPLAGILPCGARTFLHRYEIDSDCLAGSARIVPPARRNLARPGNLLKAPKSIAFSDFLVVNVLPFRPASPI